MHAYQAYQSCETYHRCILFVHFYACMHIMHAHCACTHTMHACYACILCIHVYDACMLHVRTMHTSILRMHALYACILRMHAYISRVHTLHACAPSMHAMRLLCGLILCDEQNVCDRQTTFLKLDYTSPSHDNAGDVLLQ